MIPDVLIPVTILNAILFIFGAWLKLSDRDDTPKPDSHGRRPER